MYNGIRFTEDSDIEKIAETSFGILNGCGVSVEHEELAKNLAHIDSISMLGCPVSGLPPSSASGAF